MALERPPRGSSRSRTSRHTGSAAAVSRTCYVLKAPGSTAASFRANEGKARGDHTDTSRWRRVTEPAEAADGCARFFSRRRRYAERAA
jgi:hypothetical protein